MKNIAAKTTARHGAAPDQLSGREHKPSRAAEVYDLFEKISERVDPYDHPDLHYSIDELRNEVVLQIVREEVRS